MYGLRVTLYNGHPYDPETQSVSSYQDFSDDLWSDRSARLSVARRAIEKVLEAIDDKGFNPTPDQLSERET